MASFNPTSKNLTSSQLAELKKGRKANFMIGPSDNRFIALEGVSVNLLAHFSGRAHKKLIEERGSVLTIPTGSKKAVSWIYKYMLAGQRDPQGLETFESLNSNAVVLLYRHCAFLDYAPLMTRIYQRLKGKFVQSLPTTQEIELFQAAIPSLYQYAVHIIASEMVNPWACDYTAYQDLTETNKAYGKDLDDAIHKLLTTRVKRGEEYYARTRNSQVLWSRKYLNAVAAAKKPRKEHKVRNLNTKVDASGPAKNTRSGRGTKSHGHFTCYKCGGQGHMARNCTAPGHRHAVQVIEVGDFGGGLKTCDREVRKGELTRTGLRI